MTEKANKKYKDSVFVDLFYEDESAEENEIALYCRREQRSEKSGWKMCCI